MSRPSAFKTPEGEAAFLAAYNAAMKLWPVPYDEMDIPTPFGMTHVIAGGPRKAPPVVLLHGYWRHRRCGGPTSRISARTIGSMPSMSWGSPVRGANTARSVA